MLQIFKHNLLTIVQDHHREFLSGKGINLTIDVTSWHDNFDVEALPDIDSVDYPPKPFVDVVKSAPEMIKVPAMTHLICSFLVPPLPLFHQFFKEKRDVAHDCLKCWVTVKG